MSENLHKFNYNGATITVRPPSGRDLIWQRVAYAKMLPGYKAADYDYWLQLTASFSRIISQTVAIEGELDSALPGLNQSPEELRKSAEALLDIDRGELFAEWEDQIRAASEPVNDPDLVPPEMLTPDQKKAPKSAKSDSDSEAK